MDPKRIRFVQSGTGQVGYLYADATTGKWCFDLFIGGPVLYQRSGQWDSYDLAIAALKESAFQESSP